MPESFRWGDSDSSDEDEIRVSSLTLTQQTDDAAERNNGHTEVAAHPPPIPAPAHYNHPPRAERSPSAGNFKPKGGGRHNNRSKSGGARALGPPRNDWKEMAKSASRFGAAGKSYRHKHISERSLTFCIDQRSSLDGSAWMAQRRAKQTEQEEVQRAAIEGEKKKQEEEKRQRRKSQLQALKVH